MFIALVDFHVAPENRDTALSALQGEATTVRAMPGCRTFRPHCDPDSGTHVGVVHEWDSADAFGAYVASPGFADSGKLLRPMMTQPPSSRRYSAELIEDVK
ncbi:putative quinol monooxygenase [Pseudoruegeria sp. HB172150]|uniref:putative quinol monooxygenase n=1 Tax=Pseudoruegeria sp. HB172150 TaxID=2721164 RepID=UPI001551A4AF|nr:putative quinol monooxygenase [Pseudoruegeria sp. HB172150]